MQIDEYFENFLDTLSDGKGSTIDWIWVSIIIIAAIPAIILVSFMRFVRKNGHSSWLCQF